MRVFLSGVLVVLLLGMSLAGCSRTAGLSINSKQTLVLDASIVAAGISASRPSLSRGSAGQQASARVGNTSGKPVTLHYRFYWYDQQGLDVSPLDVSQTVTIPAHTDISLVSTHVNPAASQVRLYLFL
ncbi:YcfL family protein [Dickeya chrysanthemi]|uniref:YcfL family protein n=1 Tax=Dickeya chrysanthemi TaxID=556 RepID=UPI0030188C5F